MSKKHDENQDVYILTKECKLVINGKKTIYGSKNQVIGNKAWGRIDYLTKYCGYVFIWDNTLVSKETQKDSNAKTELKKTKKTIKKARKEHDINNVKPSKRR